MSIFNGVAGHRAGNPIGVCFHNDTGSASADCGFYEGWLPNHDPESGFAHAYVAEDGVLIAEDLSNKAWHCGDSYGRMNRKPLTSPPTGLGSTAGHRTKIQSAYISSFLLQHARIGLVNCMAMENLV